MPTISKNGKVLGRPKAPERMKRMKESILKLLSKNDMHPSDISDKLGIARSEISGALKSLLSQRKVKYYQSGRGRMCKYSVKIK